MWIICTIKIDYFILTLEFLNILNARWVWCDNLFPSKLYLSCYNHSFIFKKYIRCIRGVSLKYFSEIFLTHCSLAMPYGIRHLCMMMACCLFSAKPLPEQIRISCQLNPKEQTWIKIQNLSFKKMHLKILSAKWWPFFQSSICWEFTEKCKMTLYRCLSGRLWYL